MRRGAQWTRGLIGGLVGLVLLTGCADASSTRARVVTIADAPPPATAGPTAGGDALEQRTLGDLAGFVDWLGRHGVAGVVGEVGWPDHGDGDARRWNRLAERWYDRADAAGLPVSAWAAGAHWGDYPLAAYDTGTGDAISVANSQSEVLESHLGDRAGLQRGIAVAGGSFGDSAPMFSNRHPGRHGRDYWYPTAADLRYIASRGFDFVRIDFRWERLQRRPGGPLDAAELRRLRRVIGAADDAGLRVVLDLHNYGEYRRGQPDGPPRRTTVGTSALPTSALVDLWTRLSKHFGEEPTVMAYGLMNEPHDLRPTADEINGLARWTRSVGTWTGPVTHDERRGRGHPGSLRIRWSDDARSEAFVVDGGRQLDYCARNGSLLSVWVYLPADAAAHAWSASLQVQDVAYRFRAGPHQQLEPGRWTQIRYSVPTTALGACRALAVHIVGPADARRTDLWLDDLEQRGRLLPAQVWEAASQAVVSALRERGDDTQVFVAGHNWSKVQTWQRQHPRPWITDPAGATTYEAHHYWDADQSSAYSSYTQELRRAQRGGRNVDERAGAAEGRSEVRASEPARHRD